MLSTKQQSGTSYTGVSTGWIWFRRAVPKVWGINAQMCSDELMWAVIKPMLGSDNLYSLLSRSREINPGSAYVLQHRCTHFLVTQFSNDVI